MCWEVGVNGSGAERTLVTGFGPFLSVGENPSERLAGMLGRPFQVLEVAYEAVDAFLASVDETSFDRLMMIGVATNRKQITPELFARNFNGHVHDVRGVERFGDIESGAPLMIESTLWSAEMLASLFPNPLLEISYDAGEYLCNYVYYRALRRFADKCVGFVHVPDVEAVPFEKQLEIVRSLVSHVESR